MLDVAHLNELIERSGLAGSAIERMAGLSNSYIYRMRQGSIPLTRRTLSRIRLAMSRLRHGETNPNEVLPSGSYRLAVAYVAMVLEMQPEMILAADPARRATADVAWMRAARARRWAVYIANQYLNVPQAALARAARMSKAAVSIAMNDVEDERGDPILENLLAAVEEAFSS
ncbi:hypothetical protein HF272_13655 [Rhizobium leguminosarum]|uniref:hypothetical protein n=1 Tax=Rhizobium leguminosarum TaxID=384 RepID=UPI001C9021F7|nr:hypothetical protein [Rhizobium leguminosarum]MBY2992475.1 hypothetical protein [Rhizobium leguminosarum]